MRSLATVSLVLLTALATVWGCDAFEGASGDGSREGELDAWSGEAGGDAGRLADADADSCPPGAILCDDFERATLVGPWGGYTGEPDAASGSSSATIDTAAFSSEHRSLRSDPRDAASSAALTTLLPLVDRVDVTFSLRTEAATSASVHILAVETKKEAGYVQLILQNGGLHLVEQLRYADGGEYYELQRVTDAPVGAFARFTLRVDRRNARFALFAEDGAEIGARPLVQDHEPISKVYLGTVFTSGPSGPHWFDDVIVTTTP